MFDHCYASSAVARRDVQLIHQQRNEQCAKVFGIGVVVSKFGPQIDKFVNTLLNQHGVKWEGTTKVVPIISIGSGGHVGAAQVAGAPEIVKQTKAVGQGEVSIGGLRGKLLVPMSTTNPLKGVKKVKGVGVTAIIDFRI